MQAKNEQMLAEKDKTETKPVTGIDSNMMIVRTGGCIIQRRTQDEIAEDAVALLLKHSVGHQEISNSEESGSCRKKKKTDCDSSWIPPQGKAIPYAFFNQIHIVIMLMSNVAGQSGDGRTSLNDRFGY